MLIFINKKNYLYPIFSCSFCFYLLFMRLFHVIKRISNYLLLFSTYLSKIIKFQLKWFENSLISKFSKNRTFNKSKTYFYFNNSLYNISNIKNSILTLNFVKFWKSVSWLIWVFMGTNLHGLIGDQVKHIQSKDWIGLWQIEIGQKSSQLVQLPICLAMHLIICQFY